MIALTLGDIAQITGGALHGRADHVVTGPAVIDSRQVAPGTLFCAIAGEHVDGHDYVAAAMASGAAAVLCSRADIDAPAVVVDDVVVALGRIAHHVLGVLAQLCVIAVTGSAGKTSVKDMLAHVLEAEAPTVAAVGSFNNELGLPLTILRADESTRFLVLEMGARGIGHIRALCDIARPDVAVVLNVGSAHASEFGSRQATAQAKGELVEALAADGTAVLNADDPLVAPMAARTVAPVLTFGTSGAVRLGPVTLDDSGFPSFSLTVGDAERQLTVPQLGRHQAINAAAACAAATAAGVEFDAVVAALGTATAASPMRMERVQRADGLVVINDAYNANPESVAEALCTLAAVAPERGVAVLGEMLELGNDSQAEHEAMGRLAAELGIGRVVAVGAVAADIARGAGGVPSGPIVEAFADVESAARTLVADLSGEDVVLVKASRGVRLERVAQALLDHSGTGKEDPGTCLPS